MHKILSYPLWHERLAADPARSSLIRTTEQFTERNQGLIAERFSVKRIVDNKYRDIPVNYNGPDHIVFYRAHARRFTICVSGASRMYNLTDDPDLFHKFWRLAQRNFILHGVRQLYSPHLLRGNAHV
jgi:hypothetical protein